jgi:hypothetical protein
LELEKFKRTTPAMINAIAVIRAIDTGSLKIIIPRIAVPAAPIPVQTAYAVPIGRTLSDHASKEMAEKDLRQSSTWPFQDQIMHLL